MPSNVSLMELLSGQSLDDQQYEILQAISLWLNSEDKDYHTGLELLAPHCRNRMLLLNLQKKQNSFNRQKLDYELGKLIASPELLKMGAVPVKVLVLQSSPVEIKPTESEQEPVQVDQEESLQEALKDRQDRIDAIILTQKELYQRKTELSNQLVASGDSNDPAVVAERLLLVQESENVEAHYNQLAEQKERLLAGIQEPATEPTQAITIEHQSRLNELKLRRKALAPNVTKARKAFEAKPDDVLKQEKLARLEAELREIDDQIKLLSEP